MRWKYKSKWKIIFIVAVVIMQVGCATVKRPYWKQTSYGSWNFSNSEVKKLPDISLRNILSKVSLTHNQRVQVLVKIQNLDGIMDVKKIADQNHIIVTDAEGKEIEVRLAKITEIQTVRWIKINPKGNTKRNAAAGTVEALSYAPIIPLAIATWPFLKALGLDAGKNAADNGKALMAYGGMSRKDLLTFIGKPLQKYYCKSKNGDYEIWIYRKDQVLRGGRAIFISLDKDNVYNTSYNTTFFKQSKNCSVISK